MDILKFNLRGKNAFFKMPEVNTYYYFTYGNIHKVALLGIFGAILGYDGYQQQRCGEKTEERTYPQFYEQLQGLSVSVVPKEGSKGYISKKIQSFNNSVGYASRETGGNLIVKEQWLDCPEWDIYVKLDCEDAERIKESMLERRCIYMPYLGSNDHPADITAVEVLAGTKVETQEIERVHSLVPVEGCTFDYEEDEIVPYKYQEFLPAGLDPDTNQYVLRKIIYTNLPVLAHSDAIYRVGEKNIIFY